MPILKQLVSGSGQSKRRSRADLTPEMISAPLGDFRHTMHVGRGGDAFGDTSFLSSRSGEPPREPRAKPDSPGSRPGLLSRTFRSSKRSHSVNRGDRYEYAPAPLGGSSAYVKNAISLPYLNDEGSNRGLPLTKSASSGPAKRPAEAEKKPANGAAIATLEPELEERSFGQLTDLPPPVAKGGGMKHAESVMSFHLDLGPSMLGDILSVMERKSWEEDDLGYASPPRIPLIDEEEEEEPPPLPPPARPPRSARQRVERYAPELPSRNRPDPDSCSVSSSGSAPEEKPGYRPRDADTDSARFSSPREDHRDFTFMDEEEDEDEIRV